MNEDAGGLADLSPTRACLGKARRAWLKPKKSMKADDATKVVCKINLLPR
jgi:hypothetical protein